MTNINLASLTNTNGFKISGVSANAKLGFSVSGGKLVSSSNSVAIAGLPYSSPGITEICPNQAINCQFLDISSSANFGCSVAYARGDFNQDGYNDIIVGDPSANNNNGAAYIYSNNQLVLIINGESGSGKAGYSVAGAGDFNGDGIPDLIIGAPFLITTSGTGTSYVIFGSKTLYKAPSTLPATINLSSLSSLQGIKLIGYGSASKNSAWSVSGAGDIDGDGISDVIIGDPGYNNYQGRAVIVIGLKSTPSSITLNCAYPNNPYKYKCIDANQGDKYFGYSVSGAGNINADKNNGYNLDDIIIGAPYTGSKSGTYNGKIYIYLGTSVFYNSAITLKKITIDGAPSSSYSGWSVSAAGDVNKDGFADVIIGAPYQSSANNAGLAYIIYGTQCPSDINLASLINNQGFSCTGASGDQTGYSVSAVGDIDGNGFGDVIIGAPNTNSNAGAAYVVYGFQQSTTPPPTGPVSITGGVYKATVANTEFNIAATSRTTIEERGCNNNDQVYKFGSKSNSYNMRGASDASTEEVKITITSFNVNNDVIDLTSYPNINNINQLEITADLVMIDDATTMTLTEQRQQQ